MCLFGAKVNNRLNSFLRMIYCKGYFFVWRRIDLKQLLRHMKKYRFEAILGPLFKLLEAALELYVPLVVADLIDNGISSNDTGYITARCLTLILLAAIGLVSSVTAQFFAAKAAIGFSAGLRSTLMQKIGHLSFPDLDKLGTATMITRMTSDINQIQTGVNLGLRLLLRSPFVVFGAFIMAFRVDRSCSVIFLIVIIVLLVIVFGIMLLTIPMYRNVQTCVDGVTSVTRENLKGTRVIRAFCAEEKQISVFTKLNDRLNSAQIKSGKWSAVMNPLTYAVLNIAVVFLIKAGALRVETGILTSGQVIALYNYMTQILVELIKMANLIITLTRSAACAGRVSDILRMPDSESEGGLSFPEEPYQREIRFENVSFSYNSSAVPVLHNISFTAAPGSVIGIIGGTASGKSTLVSLIPRNYRVSSGRISLNGIDINEYDTHQLNKHISFVRQKASLFRGTIRSNLLMGSAEASDQEIQEAVRCACAEDIISSKISGLDEPVEQGGNNFSGGQRQRLSIARALVCKPDILILDDSSSALDFATEASLRKALRSLPQKPTIFIVSQRSASVRFADHILVLEDGHLIADGTHDELLESCPVYREIHYSQFGGEEDCVHE